MKMLKELWASKKFRAAIAGMAVVLLSTTVGLPEDQAEQLVQIIMFYIVGQGLADVGKEAEKLKRN
jgi:hypothetical protein